MQGLCAASTGGVLRCLVAGRGTRGRDGPAGAGLQWQPDSSRLLVESYRRGANPEQGTAEPVLLDPRTLERQALPLAAGENRRVFFPPGGNYLMVGQYGVITRDGKDSLKDPSLWNRLWSPDERFLLLGGGDVFALLAVATGGPSSCLPRPNRRPPNRC